MRSDAGQTDDRQQTRRPKQKALTLSVREPKNNSTLGSPQARQADRAG